ncbi:MAG: hypothetical protein KatS3mg110_4499 [Pirellulaceae bacterium]|nr:MAG: hypothetical protein KatS3mg110_4499 [Pirellulaceae bacterium]
MMKLALQRVWRPLRVREPFLVGLALSAGLLAIGSVAGWAGELAEAEPLTFERQIRPILRAYCWDCHGATAEPKGGLDLRLVRWAIRGGESGPALVPGDPDQSLLLRRIRDGEMPPGNHKVTAGEQQILEQWIRAGAPTARPEPEELPPGIGIAPEDRDFWSFRPIRRPPVPLPPMHGDRIRTPIDAFLLADMPEGLSFAPDADKQVLVRRVYLDLLGLPPTYEQVEEFLRDSSPDAYERLVDRLLASPHYGERWGRHWLDVAGYADSEGGAADAPRPWAYRYRDYVIRSLNEDKPFDQFVAEQLAGDELAGAKVGEWTDRQIELLSATGFLRMAPDATASDDSPENRYQALADTLRIVGSSLLGVTLHCAQCHDHRYDPIPQSDYYGLAAVFAPALDPQAWRRPSERLVSLYTEADRREAQRIEDEAQAVLQEKQQKLDQFLTEALEKELAKYDEPLRGMLREAVTTPADKRSDEQKQLLASHPNLNITPGVLYQYNQAAADELKKYDAKVAEIRAKKPAEMFVRALVESPGHLPVTRRLHRGDYRQPQEEIAPGFLQVLCPDAADAVIPLDDPQLPTSGRRLELARRICRLDNPLTARVIVNRVWMHHFGRGLVATPDDFGRLGSPPTHPALLDWLAHWFGTEAEWSLKRLHRLILLSTVYRQASQHPDALRLDPDNRYYSRKPIWRLEAEWIRDRMLFVSGTLAPQMYGPPAEVAEDETGKVIVPANERRRTIYLQVRRSRPVAFLQTFDAPGMEVNCPKREYSTSPMQALALLNDQFVLEQARRLALRVEREIPADGNDNEFLYRRAVRAWELALARRPDQREKKILSDFLKEQQQLYDNGGAPLPDQISAETQILTNVCQVLLSLPEFLYVD